MPGLIDAHAEFFAVGEELHATYGGQAVLFDELPKSILSLIQDALEEDPDAQTALKDWASKEPIDPLKQFAACRFGGLDHAPDLSAEGDLIPDFHHCGKRGSCPYEGKICVNKHGFTRREQQILRLIARGTAQKVIAADLEISEVTVAKFRKRLFDKTGCQSSVQLTRFAIRFNYVSHE